jgi:Leucine-rich repeat (LRR) protein
MWDEDDAWAVEEARKSSYFFDTHFLVVDVYKLDAHIMALNTTHQVHMLSLQATNKNPYSDAYDKSQFVVYNNLEVLEGFTNISGLCLRNVVPCDHNMFSRLLNLQSFSIKNTTRQKLGLSSTQLIGVLAGLPRLETFTLDGFSDFSSDLVNLTNLKRVFVTNSNFSVYQLFSLSSQTNLLASLQALKITDCTHMNKSLPSEIGLLPMCQDLCLSQCRLEGKIPTELGLAQSLTKLCLAVNQLTGSIPIELGLLTNLTTLELQFNRLSGNIPCCFFDLNRLEHLDFSNNKLTGAIPPTTGLASLTALDLSQNKLFGTIPATLSNLTNLTTLDVSFNKLTGQVPSELATLHKLRTFHAYSNNLSPILPLAIQKLVSDKHFKQVFSYDNDSDDNW